MRPSPRRLPTGPHRPAENPDAGDMTGGTGHLAGHRLLDSLTATRNCDPI
jgi:hypothetical protein